jgi:hypothetical protein
MPTFDDQWPTTDPVLAAFAEDLRTIAGGPAPEPRPGLVAAMRQGASLPIEPSPGRKKMLVRTLVGTLTAKLALGVGVAAASMTAAGAAGVLPDPAQHAVAAVVGAATPFALPEPSTATTRLGREAITSTTLPGAGDDADEAGDDKGGARADNHGACVSTAAKALAGTGAGKTISSVARSDCGKTQTGTPSSPVTSTTVGSPTTSSTVPGSTSSSTSSTIAGNQNRSPNAGSGSTNSGKGNSGNSGNSASSGKGNSGKD